MKRMVTMSTALAAVMMTGSVFAGDVDPGLQAAFDRATPNETVSALLYMQEQLDAAGINKAMDAKNATRAERHELVVRQLQAMADRTQGNLDAKLAQLKATGRINDYQTFWVANIVRVDGPKDEIAALVARKDVFVGYYNYEIELIKPTHIGPVDDGETIASVESGVHAIRADEVWADFGITGAGRLVSTLDTGVDGNHEALKDRWRGVADARYQGHPEWAFFDPVTNKTFPFDSSIHGTHTMGTTCGHTATNEIGVAPGAQWINAAVIDRVSISRTVSDALLAFQWIIDPDGDPATVFDVPDSCSNSWGLVTAHGYPPCDDLFWSSIDNVEAGGTMIIFSAGNEGSSGLRRPADRATNDFNVMAIAAIDGNNSNYPIASFSSRGPTQCTPDGSSFIKPNISAPGVNVRSSFPGNQYGLLSGTSMASPHINGVVALMREADPNITVQRMKEIFYQTALDLGQQGKDNSYGWGLIDAYQSVQIASGIIPPCNNLDVQNLVAGQIATFTVTKNIQRSDQVAILWGTGGNDTTFKNAAGYCATFGFDVPAGSISKRLVAKGFVDQNDQFVANVKIPAGTSGMSIMFQAAKMGTCPDECMSAVWQGVIQ